MSYANGKNEDKCPLTEDGNHIFVKRNGILWACDCGAVTRFAVEWE